MDLCKWTIHSFSIQPAKTISIISTVAFPNVLHVPPATAGNPPPHYYQRLLGERLNQRDQRHTVATEQVQEEKDPITIQVVIKNDENVSYKIPKK